MHKRRHQRGFTLVELLIVIAIIGILAGAVLLNVAPQKEKAIRARAKTDIKTMETAIEIYFADNDNYPTTQQGLQALLIEPTTPPVPRNWQGPYLRNRKTVPIDPWRNDFIYLSPGEENPDSYDLLSYGKDGRAGGEGNNADVVPWE